MNLIDMYVTEVIGEPYEILNSGTWLIRVMADGWGHVSETTVVCKSYEEACKVGPGYKFEG